jgi:hypothetical protein
MVGLFQHGKTIRASVSFKFPQLTPESVKARNPDSFITASSTGHDYLFLLAFNCAS